MYTKFSISQYRFSWLRIRYLSTVFQQYILPEESPIWGPIRRMKYYHPVYNLSWPSSHQTHLWNFQNTCNRISFQCRQIRPYTVRKNRCDKLRKIMIETEHPPELPSAITATVIHRQRQRGGVSVTKLMLFLCRLNFNRIKAPKNELVWCYRFANSRLSNSFTYSFIGKFIVKRSRSKRELIVLLRFCVSGKFRLPSSGLWTFPRTLWRPTTRWMGRLLQFLMWWVINQTAPAEAASRCFLTGWKVGVSVNRALCCGVV